MSIQAHLYVKDYEVQKDQNNFGTTVDIITARVIIFVQIGEARCKLHSVWLCKTCSHMYCFISRNTNPYSPNLAIALVLHFCLRSGMV